MSSTTKLTKEQFAKHKEAVLADVAAGLSDEQVAEKHGTTRRAVYHIRCRAKAASAVSSTWKKKLFEQYPEVAAQLRAVGLDVDYLEKIAQRCNVDLEVVRAVRNSLASKDRYDRKKKDQELVNQYGPTALRQGHAFFSLGWKSPKAQPGVSEALHVLHSFPASPAPVCEDELELES